MRCTSFARAWRRPSFSFSREWKRSRSRSWMLRRHFFKSPSSKVLTCQLAITTWALPGSVRENLHVLLRTTRRRLSSSPTMRRSTRAWGCSIGGRAITLVGSRSSAKRSCPIRTWRRRITTSASRWRNQCFQGARAPRPEFCGGSQQSWVGATAGGRHQHGGGGICRGGALEAALCGSPLQSRPAPSSARKGGRVARRVRASFRDFAGTKKRVSPLAVYSPRVLISLMVALGTALAWSPSGLRLSAPGSFLQQGARSEPSTTAAPICEFSSPGASFSVPYVPQSPALTTDPQSPAWLRASSTWVEKDCTHQIDYPALRTEVRAFWTDSDLYLLFISPYYELNLWLPPDNSKDRLKLWDRDVVEFFLGDNWTNINVYREFEIAPTGDWVDLAIDRNRDIYDADWNSGWQRQGRIDEKNHTWYAGARVPLHSVSEKKVAAGTKWRVNLYRIDGLGADPQRRFLCWQPTCVVNRDPNHVPEHFGTLVFTR